MFLDIVTLLLFVFLFDSCLIFVGEENGGDTPVGLGDYPDGGYPVLGEPVIVVGRQQTSPLLERVVVGLLVLVIHISPVAFDVAIEGFLDKLGEAGFDPVYGARPLKRAIQQQLENPLAQAILSGKFGPGDVIEVGLDGEQLSFRKGDHKASAA